MSERIERWMLRHGFAESIHLGRDNAEGFKKALMPDSDGPTRVYVIDADTEDAKKCENCKHWSSLITKGNCIRLNNLITGVNPLSLLGIECWGIETPPDFHCAYFERK